MLQPREADIPVLFLVLVVLPLATYIFLGKWNEATKKKARISTLAQLAADEAHRVETMSCVDVMPTLPSPNPVFYECSPRNVVYVCARCSAPATTRCSRCKSVRYCSGKCQIFHWRLGHKEECQRWRDGCVNLSAGMTSATDMGEQMPLLDNSKPFLEVDVLEPLQGGSTFDLPNDHSLVNTSYSPVAERKLSHSDQRFSDKFRKKVAKSDASTECALNEAVSMNTELSMREAPLEKKLGNGSYSPSNETHRHHDRSGLSYAYAPSDQRDTLPHSHKPTCDTRTAPKPRCSAGIPISSPLDRNMNKCENGPELTSEGLNFQDCLVASATEILDSCSSIEKNAVGGGIMYRRPPYVLRAASSTRKLPGEALGKHQSQAIESNTNAKIEYRGSQMNASRNIALQGCNGASSTGGVETPRKSAKVSKGNLLGLIKNYKKIKVLFPYEDLVMFFQYEVWGIYPRGLLNCGNSCYANAVLQCLSCTKPLMVYLLQRSHSRTCCARDWCLMCELEQHVLMLREGGGPLSPSRILSNINIGCRMGGGNQEDAHEFLRLLVMKMQSICLVGMGSEKEVDSRLQETTLIQQIFSGRLKSKVKCLRCHLESERYEHIMDLTLEIHGWVESLEDALTQFTAPEDLDGENMYRCGRCLKYVKARKQLSLHEVPNILTIVLKRFQTGEYGKINKCVTFPDMLDMIPFVTGKADIPPLYMLYAVVVHLDMLNASFSGHYVSYVKDLQGTWFRIDDSEVQAVSSGQVMSEGAYMLFYSRSFPRPPRVYCEKAIRASTPTAHCTSKIQKSPRHGQDKHSGVPNNSTNVGIDLRMKNRNDIRDESTQCIVGSMTSPRETYSDSVVMDFSEGSMTSPRETYSDSVVMDFSDATSSDCSLFTSSDESSFTTESTRDSFSTVDYGETGGLDALSSIFSPFYIPEYSHSSISCKQIAQSRPQTRFHSESKGFVLDSSLPTQTVSNVHKGRHPEQVRSSETNI